MQFGKINNIESQALTQELVDSLYPIDTNSQHENKDRKQIETILKIFSSEFENMKDDFTCFVFEDAMNAFVSFANEVYKNSHNEATGLIVGYYLHNPNNPRKKIVVATNFLHATGNSSNVTCEFSYEDSARHSKYCEDHKVLPIVWIHSHPGFGVFYSGTDSNTLRTYFKCAHQLGIVVDNIKNQYLAYKLVDGIQTEIDIWGVKVQQSIENNRLERFLYNTICNSHQDSIEKKKVSFKELQETNSQFSSQAQSISFKKLTETNGLDVDDLRKNIERLKDRIQELNTLVNESYSIIEQRKCDIGIEAKFTLKDIKNEIDSQICLCAEEIKKILSRIGPIKENFEKIESSIVSLNSEVKDLKKWCINSLEERKIESENVSNSINELKKICSSIVSDTTFYQSISKRVYRIFFKRNRLFLIVIISLAISIFVNIFYICGFMDTLVSSSSDNTKEIINKNNIDKNNTK